MEFSTSTMHIRDKYLYWFRYTVPYAQFRVNLFISRAWVIRARVMDTPALPVARIHVTQAAWWTLPIFNAHLQRWRTGMGKQQQQCISLARCRHFTSRPLSSSPAFSLSHIRSRLPPAAYNTCSKGLLSFLLGTNIESSLARLIYYEDRVI
jgi:hypothetical protein